MGTISRGLVNGSVGIMAAFLNYYSGIGSRKCKNNVILLDKFVQIAGIFVKYGFVLRSGHADGSDIAFEKGCIDAGGPREIYLPWKGFNGSDSYLYKSNEKAYAIARQVIPHWDNFSEAHKHLHARNAHEVLGQDLETPSKFVICWTPEGRLEGGTATAIRIAGLYNIPVFNLGLSVWLGVKPLALAATIMEEIS